MADRTCFGFFKGGDTCDRCSAAKSCRSVLLSHGFELADAVLDELVASLPPDTEFEVDLVELAAGQALGSSKAKMERTRKECESLYTQLISGGTKKMQVGSDEVDLEGMTPDSL